MLERLNSLKPREKGMLLLAGLVFLGLFVDNLIYRPLSARCRDLEMQIEDTRQEIFVNRQDLALASRLAERYQKVQERLGPPMEATEAITRMKGEIDRLARESNVRLLAIRHLEPRRMPAYSLYAVEISSFEAPEGALMRFLHALHATGSTYRVSKLSITPNEAGSGVRGSLLITRIMPAAPPAGT